jgi:peptide deformylase
MRQLIALMRDTMRDAPGVGLAAPQIGESIQLAVIEDRTEYIAQMAKDEVSERKREAIPFHVIINPTISVSSDATADFFEGCLSLAGFAGLVSRSLKITVNCLNENAAPIALLAKGWYARILQHEIDHLNGKLYIDRMEPRSFSTTENMGRYWHGESIEQIRAALGLGPENDSTN